MMTSTSGKFAALAAFLLSLGAAGTAAAQGSPVCGAREIIVTALADRYGETARSIGLGPGNRLVELYASDETGTWTITVTSANGTTCLMASGNSYAEVTPPPPGEPL